MPNSNLTRLEQTFLDLVAIDEVHPNENKVLTYIKNRLKSADIPYQQDKIGNIIALIPGAKGDPVGLVSHVDIAAPLAGREVTVEADIIKTDGAGLLGGDDKAGVAAMLELADHYAAGQTPPSSPVELLFTVGEEAGCVGAVALDPALLHAKALLVFDWLGRVNNIVTKSPAYYKIDVEYTGKDAHPAHWQEGKNAGAALAAAVAGLQQGEYAPGVTCNVGIMSFGNARNKVPGFAQLQAEIRSYDTTKIEAAANEIELHFQKIAKEHEIVAKIAITKDSPAYELDQSSDLYAKTTSALKPLGLAPNLEPTYGCFDGNILAASGREVIMLGAGYYNPHSHEEYLKRSELAEVFEFMKHFVA